MCWGIEKRDHHQNVDLGLKLFIWALILQNLDTRTKKRQQLRLDPNLSESLSRTKFYGHAYDLFMDLVMDLFFNGIIEYHEKHALNIQWVSM